MDILERNNQNHAQIQATFIPMLEAFTGYVQRTEKELNRMTLHIMAMEEKQREVGMDYAKQHEQQHSQWQKAKETRDVLKALTRVYNWNRSFNPSTWSGWENYVINTSTLMGAVQALMEDTLEEWERKEYHAVAADAQTKIHEAHLHFIFLKSEGLY